MLGLDARGDEQRQRRGLRFVGDGGGRGEVMVKRSRLNTRAGREGSRRGGRWVLWL